MWYSCLGRSAGHTVVAFCLRFRLRQLLKFFREGLVIEEDPGVIEFAIPGALKIANGRDQFVEFFISDKRDEGRVGTGRFRVAGTIVAVGHTPQFTLGLASCC